jgi:hypothetical protein
MRAVLSMVLLVLFAVAHADARRNAGSNYFDEADRILANNWNADVTGTSACYMWRLYKAWRSPVNKRAI